MGLLPSPEDRGKKIVYVNPPQRKAVHKGRVQKMSFPVQSFPSLPLKHLFLPDSSEPRKRRFKGQSVYFTGIT